MNKDPRVPIEIYLNKSATAKKIKDTLEQYGVCVLKNYFSEAKATEWKNAIISWLIHYSLNLSWEPKTWISANLPYGPRVGMMQSLVSQCSTVWKIRESMYPLFKEIHGTKELFTSMDGATIHPPKARTKNAKDWAHIDQTILDLYCVQGQAVLSDTTASFVCTPTSHLYHKEILDLCGRTDDYSDQWCKFTPEQIEKIKKMLKNEDLWQVPIHVPVGSVILWYSKTIHSAQKNDPTDKKGWRCTVYVCMRPSKEYSTKDRAAVIKAFEEGRTTNHWGTKIFGKRPGNRWKPNKHSSIERLTEDPSLVKYNNPSELIRKLVGLESW